MKKIRVLVSRSLLVLMVGVTPLLLACSGNKHSSQTTTEVVRDSDEYRARYNDSPTVEVTTKTEEVSHEDNHRGFFGIIGDIIALPFRAVASIL